MGKMKLEIEALEVESFETAREDGRRGTVRGREQVVEAQAQVADSINWCQATAGYTLCPMCEPSCVTNGGQPGTGCTLAAGQVAY